MLKAGFQDVVSEAWRKFRGYGNGDAFLAAKLRFLKKEIKKWRETAFALENKELEECRNSIAQLDTLAESRDLWPHELGKRTNCVKRITEIERMAAMDMKQMAKVKWVTDGDENTSFFHGYVNNHNRRNKIHGLTINGQWETCPDDINGEILQFFSKKFEEKWMSRPKIRSNRFKTLSSEASSALELPFSVEEIRNAI
ncbi:hypothetical protein Lser_V15G37011 [Lactuca serriola]